MTISVERSCKNCVELISEFYANWRILKLVFEILNFGPKHELIFSLFDYSPFFIFISKTFSSFCQLVAIFTKLKILKVFYLFELRPNLKSAWSHFKTIIFNFFSTFRIFTYFYATFPFFHSFQMRLFSTLH